MRALEGVEHLVYRHQEFLCSLDRLGTKDGKPVGRAVDHIWLRSQLSRDLGNLPGIPEERVEDIPGVGLAQRLEVDSLVAGGGPPGELGVTADGGAELQNKEFRRCRFD